MGLLLNAIAVVTTLYTEQWLFCFFHKMNVGKKERFLIFIPLVQMLFFLILFGDVQMDRGLELFLASINFCFLILMNSIVCNFFRQRGKYLECKKKVTLLYRQRQQELAYYENVHEYLQQMGIIRHEFANQMQVVCSMLQSGAAFDEVYELLEQMERGLENLPELKNESTIC